MATDDSTMAKEIVPASEEERKEEKQPPTSQKIKRKRTEKKKVKSLKPSSRSWVWEHFEKFDKPIYNTVDGKQVKVGHEVRAKCVYCFTELAGDSSFNGTSTLSRHIEKVCKKYPPRMELDQCVLTSDQTTNASLAMRKWSSDACLTAYCKMIVMDELPFSQVEKAGFKHFCSVAVPQWTIPCRKSIVTRFFEMYESQKEKLRLELANHRVSLTTDTWTSVQNVNYMVVTAYFNDSGWRMHKRILNFCVIPNHQGTSIGKLLEACLIQWKIDKVLTVSVDNALANKVAIDYLRKKMANWAIPPILGGKHLHVRCLAHVLNLIVRSGLSILDRSVAAIRNAVKYVRSSPSRLDDFKMCVEKEVPESRKIYVLDVPTRWNSTFLMLNTALELRKGFERMAEEEEQKFYSYFDEDDDIAEDNEEVSEDVKNKKRRKRIGPPNDTDWERAAVFVQFLKVFYDATLKISASTKPTSHMAFHEIVTIEGEIDSLFVRPEMAEGSEAEKVLVSMAVKMKSKFKKYFGALEDLNQLLLVALVLDPLYKLRNFEHVLVRYLDYDTSSMKEKSRQLKELLVSLTDLYASSSTSQKNRNKEAVPSSCCSSSTSRPMTGKMAAMLDDWERELQDSCEVVVESEVDRYLLDPIELPPRNAEFNILLWWKLNGGKYPNLQALARDVLAIQVSTVASESCFSTGKRVIDPYRSSLTPKSVEALICLQNWIKEEDASSIEYYPSIEEMEFYEEAEKDFADKQSGQKAAKASKKKCKETAVAEPGNKPSVQAQ